MPGKVKILYDNGNTRAWVCGNFVHPYWDAFDSDDGEKATQFVREGLEKTEAWRISFGHHTNAPYCKLVEVGIRLEV